MQVRSHGRRKNWVVLYREAGVRKYHTVGLHSKMSKSQAQEKQAEFMKEVNARAANAPDPNVTFGDFLESVALPFYRSKWKRSTASTTESRIRHHLLSEFGPEKLTGLTLRRLQALLSSKAAASSRSTVAHLRWDLRAIFKLAVAEGYTERDPSGALFTPKEAKVAAARVMNRKEAQQHINALDLRERVIDHLALFAGMSRARSWPCSAGTSRRIAASLSSSSGYTAAISTIPRPYRPEGPSAFLRKRPGS